MKQRVRPREQIRRGNAALIIIVGLHQAAVRGTGHFDVMRRLALLVAGSARQFAISDFGHGLQVRLGQRRIGRQHPVLGLAAISRPQREPNTDSLPCEQTVDTVPPEKVATTVQVRW